MLRTAMQKPWYLAITLAIGLVCSVAAMAARPVKPPPEPPPYMLVDLLGFPGEGCQSGASFITDRDTSGGVLIGGGSNFFYPDGSWAGYPALWHVAVSGTFPETDPVSLGAAPDGTGREGKGLSRWCSGVMVTGTFQCFEQYEDGTWVVPSHVAFPDKEHVELPGVGPHHRNTHASGINDLGQIVGTYDAPNPDAPGDTIGFGGMWQLNPDGTITGPTFLGNTWTGGFAPSAINNFGVMGGGYMGWPAIAWFEDGKLRIEQLDSSIRFWGADVNSLNDCPINDPALTVVGISRRDENGDPTGHNGYAWKPFGGANSLVWLPTFGGPEGTVPADVNTRGEIVGWSETTRRDDHAFLFKNGTMFDLNTMADVGRRHLGQAHGINDDGDIVGVMGVPIPGGGEAHGFLLRPIP